MGLGAVHKEKGTTAMGLGQATTQQLSVSPSKPIALVFQYLFLGRTTLRVDGFPAKAEIQEGIFGRSLADLAYFPK